MWDRWKQQWQSRREQAAVQRRAIPDDLWKRTLVRYPFVQRRDPKEAAELRRLTSLFLDRKEFSTAGGLRLTDAMAVAVAAQAVLPILHLGLHRYDSFVGIVLHADQVVARREVADEDGVVHSYDEPLVGEAMQGGPLMLSWRDVHGASRVHEGDHPQAAYNVVIHEFAHVLDLSNPVSGGLADGVPALPPELPMAEWRSTLLASYESFVQRVESVEGRQGAASAQSVQSDQTHTAAAWGLAANTEHAHTPANPAHWLGVLDPYGAQSQDEFFAVASEAFFVKPAAMRAEHAELYMMFSRFYKQDPERDTPTSNRSRRV
jgi:MtfA peptidase